MCVIYDSIVNIGGAEETEEDPLQLYDILHFGVFDFLDTSDIGPLRLSAKMMLR